ncbi:PqqD family peptide modification chaperone [Geminocystis sp. NIES-3709]|uniref:PqqD family peptide modification chaperone n=1 Tax=Geminocystis sp. NIES-3709 TaxID=1617448 RepID=UPI0005FC8CF7|nr:PqqD family peptide modification chaperone [Geminocystis sp. NIES-3709]BAQ64673.1 hypothetical protein GM3709_1438 [Geminocystis sp. NIES-3709]
MESYQVNSSKVVAETIDGEVVIVNLEKGDYYSVVKSGAKIWNAVERELSAEKILAEILAQYDGDTETIARAVTGFIDILKNEGLILVNFDRETVNQNEELITENIEKVSFDLPTLEKYTDMEELLLLDPIHEVDEEAGWPNIKTENQPVEN